MWYFYDLNLIEINKMKEFTEDFEKVIIDLLDGKGDIVIEFLLNFRRTKLSKLLNDLKLEYSNLSKEQKKKFRKIFINNYQVKKILKKEIKAYTYSDLETLCGEEITKKTKDLSIYLYEKLKDSIAFENRYTSPLEYYKLLKERAVLKKICPFCGESIIEDGTTGNRETFDHYLPKSVYPFISMHYYNLIPMCAKCNTGYKCTEDPINVKYVKAFDPFDIKGSDNQLVIKKISILKNSNHHIKKLKIINNLKQTNEIYTWNKIFEIKKRSIKNIKNIYDEALDELFTEMEECDGKEEELKFFLKKQIKKKTIHSDVPINLFWRSLYNYFLDNPNERRLILSKIKR